MIDSSEANDRRSSSGDTPIICQVSMDEQGNATNGADGRATARQTAISLVQNCGYPGAGKQGAALV